MSSSCSIPDRIDRASTFLDDILTAIEAEKALHPEKSHIALAIEGNAGELIGTNCFLAVASEGTFNERSTIYVLSLGKAEITRTDLNRVEYWAQKGNMVLLESPIAIQENEFALIVTQRGQKALDDNPSTELPAHPFNNGTDTLYIGNFEQITNQMAAWADCLGLKCDRLLKNHVLTSTIGNKKDSQKALKEMEDIAWFCLSLRHGLLPHCEQYQDHVRLGKLASLSGGFEKLKRMHKIFKKILEAHGKSFEAFVRDVKNYD